MPRKTDPGKIKVGHGLAASDSVEVNALIPGQGEPGAAGGGSGMVQHIQDEHDAHPASSVSVDDVPKIYDANNVEGVLDELAALVPPRPASIGFDLHYFKTTGIPDWGVLKLDDATWFIRNPDQMKNEWVNYLLEDGNNDLDTGTEIYPYFWRTPRAARDFGKGKWVSKGNDPRSDSMFNVADGGYVGGGVGEAHAGAFATELDDKTNRTNLAMTHEIVPSSGKHGGKEVVVSGMVFPADRGTLALVRFAPNGFFDPETLTPEDFVKNRVLAAINLGQGIFDKCDGAPGGIFWLGDHGGDCAPHSYDPFTFPGRATGQYDLRELHTGLYRKKDGSSPDGEKLPDPFHDFDADGVQGAPAAGQVRLGTDPNSGIPVITDGIPIFGAGSMARGGGNDHNFFRYRLPYLVDYSKPHGIKWTPLHEKHRFYDKPAVALDPNSELEWAGNYREFEKDYWTFQVGRYRHQFKLPQDIIDEHTPRKCGHYVLIHFKKEVYFEDMVRDQIMPTQDKIYSANLVNWNYVGSVFNKTQKHDDADPVTASSYHVLRANVFEDNLGDKDSEFCPGPVPPIVDGEGQHEHAIVQVEPSSFYMFVSGIRYATSGSSGVDDGLHFRDLSVLLKEPDHHAEPPVYGLFESSFLTHDGVKNVEGSGTDMGDHKWLANMYPSFLSTKSFTNESDSTQVHLLPDHEVMKDDVNYRSGRVQYGFAHLQNPTTTHYPVPKKDDQANLYAEMIHFEGDDLPKFSRDAVLRAFFRRPLNHGRDFIDHTRFFNTGIKILSFKEQDRVKILWHGADHTKTNTDPILYTHHWDHPQADPWNAEKHRAEFFLDESFRLRSDFREINGSLNLSLKETENLNGPGLPHGDEEVMALPYNEEMVMGTALGQIHWLGSKSHLTSLLEPEQKLELQVAGWPDRNPPIEDGVRDTTHTSGVLIMPQHNFKTGYLPNGNIDYSGLADKPRSYVRLFHDVGEEGSSKVVIGLAGIHLEHFEWSAPNVGSNKMAILLKVPGLTTWMDIGRRDGEGPSKQDPFADGAGCMVLGPNTKNLSPKSQYGTKRCMVECNLGSAAALYRPLDPTNLEKTGTQVLVKVVIYPEGADLNLEQGGPDGSVENIAGLVGIMVQGVK